MNLINRIRCAYQAYKYRSFERQMIEALHEASVAEDKARHLRIKAARLSVEMSAIYINKPKTVYNRDGFTVIQPNFKPRNQNLN